VLSGATAIPLQRELDWLVKATAADQIAQYPNSAQDPAWAAWLIKVRNALNETTVKNPFLYYGTDWLAFGHFVIAMAFIGAMRDPVRNAWLFNFGMLACVAVVPYAFILGAIRGIPFWWRLVDCSFGVFGLVPLWFCHRWTRELEVLATQRGDIASSSPSLHATAL
jgi:hypothetical protein